ncbi:hypothetical protein Lesp02_52780 [Lentzea sp. NBRC 105346]|uniref:hypothetical protein n=1 Tax=Lentzea sp. NBRC 105346 TaxID=3032205 RepID=UPI0024A37FB7|nr:hypothetical protein [Lentzea sp. NBRC 105346]GLZ33090.1 hypothetical protein Lesp02_52780 [Lentzea sp. NBRC 105346]
MLTVMAVSAAACASSEDVALDHAADDARTRAERGRQQLELIAGDDKDVEKKLNDGITSIDRSRVFHSSTTEQSFEIDAVYYGMGQSGSAGTYAQVSVQLCVRFKASWNGSPRVEAHDVDCPPSLPTTVPLYGTIQTTVRLKN